MIDGSKAPNTRYIATAKGTGWDLLKAVRNIIWTNTEGHECVGMRASHKTMYDLTMTTTPMMIDHVNEQYNKGECRLYGHIVMLETIFMDDVIEVIMEVPGQKPLMTIDELKEAINELPTQWEDEDETT
jgi:hypothetical protein